MTYAAQIFEVLGSFVARNGENFFVSALASLVASGLVAALVVYVLRVPSLGLHLDFQPRKVEGDFTKLPVVDLSVVNRKWWISFGSNEVQFGLFLPQSFFVERKEMFLMTTLGSERWSNELAAMKNYLIGGEPFYLLRQVVHLAVHPDSRTLFLRIGGEFAAGEKLSVRPGTY